LLRIKGLTRDISKRKLAEYALGERNLQLALAGKAALVGSYAYDPRTGMIQISEGYAAIHGHPEGTATIPLSKWRAGVHPQDAERIMAIRSAEFRKGQLESNLEYRIVRSTGEVRWIESRSFISYNSEGKAQRVVGVNIDITERKQAENARRLLNAELDHRVKNALATVSAVVSQTADGNKSVANFVEVLGGRIRSMATTHELLSDRRWQGIPLTELVRRELAPYAGRNNTEVEGRDVVLCPELAQAMATVLHELVINAAKYGALSTGTGRVSIRWHQGPSGRSSSDLILDWQESGGPPVVATGKPSYGTRTIRDLIPYEFGGTVDLVLAPDGVRCRMEVPAHWLSNDGTRL
jgi:PAS domain S-box-containing protein